MNEEISISPQIHKAKRVVKLSKNTKHMDVDGAMGIHLQDEIIMDILSLLTVRSLLRFKCVSKVWKRLILFEPYFKMKHLNRAKNDQNSRKFLVSQMSLDTDNMFSFYSSSLSSFSSFSSFQLVKDVQKLDCPSNCRPSRCRIYCCRDGLSLIGVCSYPDKHLVLLLWNPSTRESELLPCPEFPTEEFCTFGLGYDSTSDDYKILKIDPKARGEILSLKSGSWRKIDQHPTGVYPVLSCMDSLAFVNGAFHWLGLSLNDFAVSFSISNEVYGQIPLPYAMCLMENTERGISVLNGMLCGYCINSREKDCFCALVMKDYGVKESWCPLFVIQCTNLYSAIPGYRFADGEVLLYTGNWFYSVLRTSKGPFGLCPQSNTYREGFVCTESVISPKLHYE
ncbi:PREDICTED: F-box/kelch-repeat protein At3g23880-like [Nicotiana attenuata]|uniref:F-boxkelch-repeat protein n=1 Tax=Nicotiana attenuata TaxID=49451 RepID=A0A1J6INB8_NICAT|nr:PREDICTED: F-box/kelch-repeat protein At3g23880-like [Nicotiana attenuata]OIS99214.1 f-boxkelch-repeat protein [Nicotiana attenuata]